ncbi:uroplakin-1a-like [Polyodon spathula]|uniref:uroplakin-1a-like n=1 Tax=Polyodon spathula TaxID=7913 RepID=UPI001B7F69A7|nr:uroplakin-1a-like [Polyodon spathula]
MAKEKGDPTIMSMLVFGNVLIALCGITLFAVTIWVVTDGYDLYPIMSVSGKDDVFAGAWIAIFTGFAFFCTAIYGIFAVLKQSRSMMLLYLIVMVIIYIFESASAITSYTHRDYLVSNSNFIKKQMLQYYADDSDPGRQITTVWNRVMFDFNCCGTDSALDWNDYTSAFKNKFRDSLTWPLNCCKRKRNYEVISLDACKIGNLDYMNGNGCFPHISFVFSRYAWAVSWFGLAILMFTALVLLLAMVYYVKL